MSKTPPSDLSTWRMTLTCDHAVECEQHRSNSYWSSRVKECPECGSHRGIVTAVQLPRAEPEEIGQQERADVQHAATQRELAKLRREEAVLRERIAALERLNGTARRHE
ncbi:MAG TPA: hypothetical protein VNQ33_07675 [Acidimicrobiales bacterium]|nr:hypothetical protein [Acidimicrobiales bacterium]